MSRQFHAVGSAIKDGCASGTVTSPHEGGAQSGNIQRCADVALRHGLSSSNKENRPRASDVYAADSP